MQSVGGEIERVEVVEQVIPRGDGEAAKVPGIAEDAESEGEEQRDDRWQGPAAEVAGDLRGGDAGEERGGDRG